MQVNKLLLISTTSLVKDGERLWAADNMRELWHTRRSLSTIAHLRLGPASSRKAANSLSISSAVL